MEHFKLFKKETSYSSNVSRRDPSCNKIRMYTKKCLDKNSHFFLEQRNYEQLRILNFLS